jgi:hypothetical protein
MVYESANFEGKSVILSPGTYSSRFSWLGRKNIIDTVASARPLPPKEITAVALFEQSFYTGHMVVLYDSNPNLQDSTGFEGKINSFIITKGEWTFYDNTDYEGSDIPMEEGQYEHSTPRIRTRQIRSVKKN